MNWIDQLKQSADKVGNIVCVGMDPVLHKIPSTIEGDSGTAIRIFYTTMIDRFVEEGVIPAIVKPNIAFYEQQGRPGLIALETIVTKCEEHDIPVLIDAKRGDIGKTSSAYAIALFQELKADAITINGYMGFDCVDPFTDFCEEGKGVYVLVRTSNPGRRDIQDVKMEDGRPLYMHVAGKVANEWYRLGIGAVVGATGPEELEQIAAYFVQQDKEVPLLLPGVGAQGAKAQDVIRALKAAGTDPRLHRINSSSAINYAYKAEQTDDYAGAAARALRTLIEECQF